MNNAKSLLGFMFLMATTSVAMGLFCYGHIPGKEGSSWVFCPSTSCYTVGDSIIGLADSKRGCADKTYPDTCQQAERISTSSGVCFCNAILCNSSGAFTISLFLPLLILPYILHKFL